MREHWADTKLTWLTPTWPYYLPATIAGSWKCWHRVDTVSTPTKFVYKKNNQWTNWHHWSHWTAIKNSHSVDLVSMGQLSVYFYGKKNRASDCNKKNRSKSFSRSGAIQEGGKGKISLAKWRKTLPNGILPKFWTYESENVENWKNFRISPPKIVLWIRSCSHNNFSSAIISEARDLHSYNKKLKDILDSYK